MNERSEIKQFNAERDAALLSMNEQTIRDFAARWNQGELGKGAVFWVAVHKARTGARSLPERERRESMSWLSELGFQHYADDLQE